MMPDYRKSYYTLFNGITDVVSEMEELAQKTEYASCQMQLEQIILQLRKLQYDAEEQFISQQ